MDYEAGIEEHIIQWASLNVAKKQWSNSFTKWVEALDTREQERLANLSRNWFVYYA